MKQLSCWCELTVSQRIVHGFSEDSSVAAFVGKTDRKMVSKSTLIEAKLISSIGNPGYCYPIEFSKSLMVKADQHIKSRSRDESSIFIIIFNRARSWIEESKRKTMFITRSKANVNTNITMMLGATVEKSIGQPSISVDGWANKPITLKATVTKISNFLKIPISFFCCFINHHKFLWDNTMVVVLTTNTMEHYWFWLKAWQEIFLHLSV